MGTQGGGLNHEDEALRHHAPAISGGGGRPVRLCSGTGTGSDLGRCASGSTARRRRIPARRGHRRWQRTIPPALRYDRGGRWGREFELRVRTPRRARVGGPTGEHHTHRSGRIGYARRGERSPDRDPARPADETGARYPSESRRAPQTWQMRSPRCRRNPAWKCCSAARYTGPRRLAALRAAWYGKPVSYPVATNKGQRNPVLPGGNNGGKIPSPCP